MEIIPFGSADIDNILSREPQRAEYLPFGAVLLDRTGKIVKYNKAEALHRLAADFGLKPEDLSLDLGPLGGGSEPA